MPKTEAQKRAEAKWRAHGVHRVAIDFTIEDYERVKAAADACHLPVGTFCRYAIETGIRHGNPEDWDQ